MEGHFNSTPPFSKMIVTDRISSMFITLNQLHKKTNDSIDTNENPCEKTLY